MNYILHLNKAFEKICEDERLTPFHVSLYFGLFQYWNMARFRNPISISRDELMRASKIGSVNTYIRCMKELDKWQYIKYIPSYNPQKGSQVYLYNFNNSNNNGIDISNNKGTDKTTKKADETQVIPSINNSNKLNRTNISNSNKRSPKKIIIKSLPPSLTGVKDFFFEKKFPAAEAEKFFNHYESNGWLVGGRSPMKNWQAAARNWILNAEKFSNGKTDRSNNNTRAGNLQATTEKNYNEPL